MATRRGSTEDNKAIDEGLAAAGAGQNVEKQENDCYVRGRGGAVSALARR